MTMLKFRILFIACIVNTIACNNVSSKHQKQIEIVNGLLAGFSKKDTLAVRSIMGAPLEQIGTNAEIINFEVDKAGDLLNEYGMPSSDKFIFKEYPEKDERLLDVTVPIVKKGNGKGRLIDADISISFVKYLPSDKILIFHVNADYKGTMIEAPDSLKSGYK